MNNYKKDARQRTKSSFAKGERKNFRNDRLEYQKNGNFKNRNDETEENSGIVFGRNAVLELLKSERTVDKIFVRSGDREGSIVLIVGMAVEKGIPVIEVDKQKLDNMVFSGAHQGVVALASQKEYCSVDDILEIAKERNEKPFIVIADNIEDPHNLGAIIRSAECVGAHGLIIPKRHSVGLTMQVAKASAGAIEHLAIAKVANIATTIEALKEKGIWVYAAEAGGDNYYETDFNVACAIVLGSEGSGVSRLVKERSDYIVSIPMYGKINSFNVSAAAAIILSEVSRQHRGGKAK